MSSIISANNPLPVSQVGAYDPENRKLVVGTARDKFRCQFGAFDTTNVWELVQTGSGMTVAPAGAASGARYLNIASGVTVNAETIILSRDTFRPPFKLAFGLSMSQRIANCDFIIEVVGVDAAGAIVTDTLISSAPGFKDAANGAQIAFNGTTPTTVVHAVRGEGISPLSASMTGQATTVATGTSPNFAPAGYYTIEVDMEKVYFSSFTIDALTAPSTPFAREQCIPDPEIDYKIRIRVLNGATAPASSTDCRLHFIRVLDTTRFSVEPRTPARTTDVRSATPVAVVNPVTAVTVSGSVTIGTNAALVAGTAAIGDVGGVTRATTGGIAANSRIVSAAASTNGTVAKASAGRLYKIDGYNAATTPRFLKIYNKASAPTVGTDVPVLTIALAPSSRFELNWADIGYFLSTGIAYALTTGAADTDTGALTAGDVLGLNVSYA